MAGPGAGKELARGKEAIARWLKAGGNLLAIGLDEEDANAFLPVRVGMKNGEHISAYFEPFDRGSPFAGVGPADVHNRDPRDISLVRSGAHGDRRWGAGARTAELNVGFCQLVPWQFHETGKMNVGECTFRRVSFLVSRLLANMDVEAGAPILQRVHAPVAGALLKNAGSRAFISTSRKRWTTRTGSFGGEQRRPAAVTAQLWVALAAASARLMIDDNGKHGLRPFLGHLWNPARGRRVRDRRVNT